jgi:DNA-binding NtrC family response regulator
MNVMVMLIDDDKESRKSLESALQLNGFQVRSFHSPRKALKEYNPLTIDVVITDYHLPGMTGMDILKAIHRKKKDTPVIIISGEQEINIASHSLQLGASAFFPKPLNIKAIITILKKLTKKKRPQPPNFSTH